MADFNQALERVLAFEGGYSFDSDDPGGETIFGISRRAHPNWVGWDAVDVQSDDWKRHAGWQTVGVHFQGLVKRIYTTYWDAIHGDELPQRLATFLFDTAVNMGVAAAVVMFEQELFGSSDGVWDEATSEAIKGRTDLDDILAGLVKRRIDRYERIIARRPASAKYRKGWLRRVKEVSAC